MLVENVQIIKTHKGIIKSFQIPNRFFKLVETQGDIGNNWLICYGPSLRKDVQIGFFYRGFSLDEENSIRFRNLLARTPSLIFFHKGSGKYSLREKKLLFQLKGILENTGDNQVINMDFERIPLFYLESLETTAIKDHPALLIKGYYLNLENKPTSYLYTLLFDRNSTKPESDVEEIFLQASNKELFNKHFTEFKKSLENIEFE